MTPKDKWTRECDKRFTLRINKEVYQLVANSAFENKRSIAREIEYLLERTLTTK